MFIEELIICKLRGLLVHIGQAKHLYPNYFNCMNHEFGFFFSFQRLLSSCSPQVVTTNRQNVFVPCSYMHARVTGCRVHNISSLFELHSYKKNLTTCFAYIYIYYRKKKKTNSPKDVPYTFDISTYPCQAPKSCRVAFLQVMVWFWSPLRH